MRLTLSLAVLACAAAACDDTSSTVVTPKADLAVAVTPADMAVVPPDLTTPVDMSAVAFGGVVVDFSTQMPVMGAAVCVYPGNTVCGTTDAMGKYALTVPGNSQIMLSFSAPKYITAYTEHVIGSTAAGINYQILKTGTDILLAGAVGKSQDFAKDGLLVVTITDAKNAFLAGATIAAAPAAGDGPYYFGTKGIPDGTAMSTSANGVAFYLNTPPADYEVTAKLTGKICTVAPFLGWPGKAAGSASARAILGGVTSVGFVCQ